MVSWQGHLLIAVPDLLDPNFFRSVVLIVKHDEEGALGLILNRPTDLSVDVDFQTLVGPDHEIEVPVHQGGPCQGPLLALHTREEWSDLKVTDQIHFSNARETIEQLISAGVEPVRYFVGYAGWTAGQLDVEVGANGWLLLPAQADDVFADEEGMWEAIFAVVERWRRMPGLNPSMVPYDPGSN